MRKVGRRQYLRLLSLVEPHADTITPQAQREWDRAHDEWLSGARFITVGSAFVSEVVSAAREDGVTEDQYRAIKRIANVKREGGQ